MQTCFWPRPAASAEAGPGVHQGRAHRRCTVPRLSDARLDEQGLKKLLEEAEKMITKRDEDADG